MLRTLCSILLLASLSSCGALAPTFAKWKPEYASVDPNTALYFKNLKRTWTGPTGNIATQGCCDVSDCHTVDYDVKDGHYRVKIDGKWIPVPDEASQGVSSDRPNPTGSAVACYVNAGDWEGSGLEAEGHYSFFCFVPGTGS